MTNYIALTAFTAVVASVNTAQAEEARANWHVPADEVGIIYHGNGAEVAYRVCYTQGDASKVYAVPANGNNNPISGWYNFDIELGSCSDVTFSATRLRIMREPGEEGKSASGYYVRLN